MDAPRPTRTFKALSALLTYPTVELCRAVPEIEAAIAADGLVPKAARAALRPLLADLAAQDLYDLQERYVDLFDKTRRHSLNLFEHIHGESRDRGQAMVDLVAHYRKGELQPEANELPDFIPLFLEFLSAQPLGEARALLNEAAHVFATLEERLARRSGGYAGVFTAILALAGPGAAVDRATGAEDESDDLASLDAAWEETAVTFGPASGAAGCPADRLEIRMRALGRDARRAAS